MAQTVAVIDDRHPEQETICDGRLAAMICYLLCNAREIVVFDAGYVVLRFDGAHVTGAVARAQLHPPEDTR